MVKAKKLCFLNKDSSIYYIYFVQFSMLRSLISQELYYLTVWYVGNISSYNLVHLTGWNASQFGMLGSLQYHI